MGHPNNTLSLSNFRTTYFTFNSLKRQFLTEVVESTENKVEAINFQNHLLKTV